MKFEDIFLIFFCYFYECSRVNCEVWYELLNRSVTKLWEKKFYKKILLITFFNLRDEWFEERDNAKSKNVLTIFCNFLIPTKTVLIYISIKKRQESARKAMMKPYDGHLQDYFSSFPSLPSRNIFRVQLARKFFHIWKPE